MSQIGKKAINAQVQQLVAKVKATKVLVAPVDLLDKSGAVDVPIEVLKTVAEKVLQKHASTSFMLVAAGTRSCQVFAVRAANEQKLSALQWMLACSPTDSDFGSDEQAHGEIECPPPQSALKRKDEIIQMAFDYLRSNDLMPDDESSEDMVEWDF